VAAAFLVIEADGAPDVDLNPILPQLLLIPVGQVEILRIARADNDLFVDSDRSSSQLFTIVIVFRVLRQSCAAEAS